MFPATVFGPMSLNRPFGVTLLALLTMLGGLLYLAAALGFFGLALLADRAEVAERLGPGAADWLADDYFLAFMLLGVFVLIIATAFFVTSHGLLTGSGWAWTLAVIVTLLSLAGNLVSVYAYGLADQTTLISTLFGFVLAVLVLAYLATSGVRRFFGKL